MRMAVEYGLVAAGGALGAVARLGVSKLCAAALGTSFPIGTMVINISGSFFLGWFMTYIGPRAQISDAARAAIAIGFTGAYTTFSTLMYESYSLAGEGASLKAMANVFISLALGLVAVWAGIQVARA